MLTRKAHVVRSSHPLYKRWRAMRSRCANPNRDDYARYGAQGVAVCERWSDFWAFVADVGECPGDSYTLDRIDSARGYEPGNVRWATRQEQAVNRRSTVLVEYEGRVQCIRYWARELGMCPKKLSRKLKDGWTIASIVATPKWSRKPTSLQG